MVRDVHHQTQIDDENLYTTLPYLAGCFKRMPIVDEKGDIAHLVDMTALMLSLFEVRYLC